MTIPAKQDDEQTKETAQASTSKYDRLEKLATAAAQADQARRWRARKNGMANAGEPSEVRSLNDDADAKAQAEAAMQQMMAKSGGKQRRR